MDDTPAGPDGKVPPVAYLICNRVPTGGGDPQPMSFGEVETLFHERPRSAHAHHRGGAGFDGVEWDAVDRRASGERCHDRPTLMAWRAITNRRAPPKPSAKLRC